jgi:predicted nucleotidyltransferase
MGTTKKEILQKLKAIKPLLQEKYNLTELALFGSYARDEQHMESDIDIMVKLSTHSFRSFCDTAYTLEDLFPGIKVQIVSRGGIRPQYFERLKEDLIYA